MRKLLSLIIAVFVLFGLCATIALPQPVEAASVSDLTYKIQSYAVFITDCKTTATGNLVIPSHIGGYPVVSIAKSTFSGCSQLTSITLPSDYIAVIPERAFSGCTSLTSITIPDGVSAIYPFAFEGCTNLSTIILPDSVKTIDRHAFEDTAYYKDYSNWENSVLYISNHLVKADSSISGSYTIKEGTRSLGDQAFAACKSLTNITIPNSIEYISVGAFAGCSGLSAVNLPNSIKLIENGAFQNCTGISNVIIPKTVTAIYYASFEGCNKLASVSLSKETTHILNGAFRNCESLTDIWYSGTESDKQRLTIEGDNTYFENATWHYNCCQEHSFDNACDSHCNRCDYVRVASKHAYDNNCDSTCNICGSTRVTSHQYNNACDSTCNVCGSSRTTSHTYDNTCDAACNVCSMTRTVSHRYDGSWSKNQAAHWKTCVLCGHKANQSAHIPGSAATETTAQTCTECSYVIKAALGHTHSYRSDWSKDAAGHWYTCTCGSQKDYAEHNYKNTCDADCDTCGYIRMITHKPGSAATTTTDQTCITCGEILNNATGETTTTPPVMESTSPPNSQPVEPETQPSAPSVEPNTRPSSMPSNTDTTQPEGTPVAPTTEPLSNNKPSPDTTVWIVVVGAVALLGGGAVTGILIWKKKR